MEAIWDWLAEQTNADVVAYFKHYYCLTYYIGTSPYEKPGAVYVHNWATGTRDQMDTEKKRPSLLYSHRL